MPTVEQAGQSNPITCHNYIDAATGNPESGYAHGVGMSITWQHGPRGKNADGTLAAANGAFVEDAILAARQRLNHFQNTKFAHQDNADAIECLDRAIDCLRRRAKARAERGVLGLNIV